MPEADVKIHKLRFKLRKLNPLDHLAGVNSLRRVYDVYQRPDKSESIVMDPGMIEKVKKHYCEVFMCGVVSVNGLQLSRKPIDKEDFDKKLFVEHLLTDWSLAEELYQRISEFTYGKKKLRLLHLQKSA